MAGRPPDVDLELLDGQDPPALRDGHETLLPSVTRSALSARTPVIAPQLDPSGFQDVSATPVPVRTDDRPRGVRAGDGSATATSSRVSSAAAAWAA
jgi:hypothetical protein